MANHSLYKTSITIWSEYPGDQVQLSDLAREAEEGDAYCSKQESQLVVDPLEDPEFPDTEFFDLNWREYDEEELPEFDPGD